MVGNHIAQGTRHVKVSAALFHADGFGNGDLYVINVAVVPDGLEDAVAEAKHQDVLDRFFPEIVIDAVDLAFGEYPLDFLIEIFGGPEIVAKGFLKNDAAPV